MVAPSPYNGGHSLKILILINPFPPDNNFRSLTQPTDSHFNDSRAQHPDSHFREISHSSLCF